MRRHEKVDYGGFFFIQNDILFKTKCLKRKYIYAFTTPLYQDIKVRPNNFYSINSRVNL